MRQIGTTATLSNQDIGAAPVLAGSFTAVIDSRVVIECHLSGLVGSGNRSVTIKDASGAVYWVGDVESLDGSDCVIYRELPRVADGTVIRVYVESDVAGDTTVGIVTSAWAVGEPADEVAADHVAAGTVGALLQLVEAAVAGKRTHVVETGVHTIKDASDNTLRTLTPSVDAGVITLTPS